MQQLAKARLHVLEDEEQADGLDAAAGGAGAGPGDHQHQEKGPGELRPEVEVGDGKAGGGHDAAGVEGGLVDAHPHRAHLGVDVAGDDGRDAEHDGEVEPHLLVLEGGAPVAKEEVVDAEIDPEEGHKDGADPLQVDGIAGHAVVFDAEAPGAGGAEGGAEAVEEGHPPRQQEEDADDR